MMPFLWNWAATEATKAFPWKWVLIVAACLVLLGGGVYAVHTYNSAIEDRGQIAEQKRMVEEAFEAKAQETARLRTDLDRMSAYMENAELRRLQLEKKVLEVTTRKVKRDEKGDIVPDDPLLADLRLLFPASDKAGAVHAGTPPGPAMPR